MNKVVTDTILHKVQKTFVEKIARENICMVCGQVRPGG